MAYHVIYCTRPEDAKCPRASTVNAVCHCRRVVTSTYYTEVTDSHCISFNTLPDSNKLGNELEMKKKMSGCEESKRFLEVLSIVYTQI